MRFIRDNSKFLTLYSSDFILVLKKGKDEFEYERLEEDHTTIEQTWCAMEELVSLGYTRMLGLSNFNSDQITRILGISSVCPVMNEVRIWHP